MKDSNRFLVAPIANQLAASFVDWNLKVRQQQALGTRRFLSDELAKAKVGLEEQERQLETFKNQTRGINARSARDKSPGALAAASRTPIKYGCHKPTR
jgi:succinoglycan biosynthesis transport protein ExoP